MGEGVRQSGVSRSEIFVQTKLYPNQYSHAEQAIDEALSKLDIGYIDMMLLHHPASDDVTAYQAIEQAIREGKVDVYKRQGLIRGSSWSAVSACSSWPGTRCV